MVLTRILVALVWIPIVIGITFFGRPVHFMLYMQVFNIFIIVELFGLLAGKGYRPHKWLVLLAGALLIFVTWYNPEWIIAVVIGFFLVELAIPVFRSDPRKAIDDSGVSLLSLFYVPVLISFCVAIRSMEMGKYYMTLILLAMWCYDAGAFFVGRSIGKHKLAPNVSPKKSIEGFIGGMLITIVAVQIFIYFLPAFHIGIWQSIVFTLILVLAGTVGDLIESAFKRDAIIKDAGAFLPGHGGLMDRFDSTFYAAPFLYGFMLLITPGNFDILKQHFILLLSFG